MKFSILHILIFIFLSWNSFSKTIQVCKTCEITSIKRAITFAAENDTLLIRKGVYKEFNIEVNKSLTLIGENYPVIDGELKGEIIRISADNVTLDGLFIINVGTSYTEDFSAVRVVKSMNFVIQNLVLEKLFFGIYLEKSSHGKVYHNKIIGDAEEEFNSGNGIQLWYSHHIEVDKNIITHVRDGIYLEFADHCSISHNISRDNVRYGLHFMFSNDAIYEDNLFENNGAGVAVMFSKKIEMYHNTFQGNWGTASYGLLLKEINDSKIKGNIFKENTTGINIEGSNRVTYSFNTFEKNGWAIKSRGACYTNTFSNNNFLYNTFDLSYNSKLNDNIFTNNYWSDYSGYDLDKDNIGDVPHKPVKLFSYVANKTPEAIILLRSLFIDIINFSEKVSPIFTPNNLEDTSPKMKPVVYDRD